MCKVEPEVGTYVVVTTTHRGVFAGRFVSRAGDEITLTDARVCVYWSATVRGFIGLAVTGPLSGSRVSLAAKKLTLPGITSIIECSPEATKQWESGTWS